MRNVLRSLVLPALLVLAVTLGSPLGAQAIVRIYGTLAGVPKALTAASDGSLNVTVVGGSFSIPVVAPASGTCVTPAYTFTGDTNSGVGWLGADNVALCAGGATSLDVTAARTLSSVPLGIGGAPSGAVQLYVLKTAGTSQIANEVTGTGNSSTIYVQNNTTGNYAQFDANGSTVAGTTFGVNNTGMSRLVLAPSTSSVGAIGTITNAPLVFGANSTEWMRLGTGGLLTVSTLVGGGTSALSPVSVPFELQADGSVSNQLGLVDTHAQGTGFGGAMSFSGKYTDAGAYARFAKIEGAKLNSTTANTAAYMSFLLNAESGTTTMAEIVRLTKAGGLIFGLDNTYDIGATGATRPRSGYFGTSIISPILQGSGTGTSVANVGANSCGTSAASIAGNQVSGVITVGATAGTQCRVTFTTAAPTARDCTVTDSTTTVATRATVVDTTNTDFLGAFAAGDKITYQCTVR